MTRIADSLATLSEAEHSTAVKYIHYCGSHLQQLLLFFPHARYRSALDQSERHIPPAAKGEFYAHSRASRLNTQYRYFFFKILERSRVSLNYTTLGSIPAKQRSIDPLKKAPEGGDTESPNKLTTLERLPVSSSISWVRGLG